MPQPTSSMCNCAHLAALSPAGGYCRAKLHFIPLLPAKKEDDLELNIPNRLPNSCFKQPPGSIKNSISTCSLFQLEKLLSLQIAFENNKSPQFVSFNLTINEPYSALSSSRFFVSDQFGFFKFRHIPTTTQRVVK